MVRLLRPKLVLKRAEMIRDIRHVRDIDTVTPEIKAAWSSLRDGASGTSLADVVLALFGRVLDKSYQKPDNWTGLLSFAHYDYAIDDVIEADNIMSEILEAGKDGDLLRAYLGLRARKATVRLVEPQVPELVELREHGMPINGDIGVRYVKVKRVELASKVRELVDLEPTLQPHIHLLSDPNAGLDDGLKKALAAAFEARGVQLRHTAATGAAQVGEKDLRACRAAQIDASRPLFNAWVAVCRAKKCSNMAGDVAGFASRSGNWRLRALLSHGPITGRLSASEPNVQQFPRDQLFRAMCMSLTYKDRAQFTWVVNEINQKLLAKAADRAVEIGETVTVDTAWLAALFASAKDVPDWPKEERTAMSDALDACFTSRIVASDFGALDVRVGAALAIRAQREMLQIAAGHAVPYEVQPPEEVVRAIKDVARYTEQEDLARVEKAYQEKVATLEKQLKALSDSLEKEEISRSYYFQQRGVVKSELMAAKLGMRFAQCLRLGGERGEREYSALRDAFVAEIDIHTFTGMKLVGRDPMKEFEGLSVADRKSLEKKLKKELGPRRQQGKIANLSLLYGMADAGFQEAAARGYDEHWTLQEAGDIRSLWMNAYPEVELWHIWTDCLQNGVVYLPELGKEKPVRTGWWLARTLAGRDIVAYGLNAALSYQDQSTGADILGMIMHRLKLEHPAVFDCSINQVHDELVLEFPPDRFEEYLNIVETVMVEEANRLLMPYGVPAAVSPACGVLWIKD